MKSIKKSRVDYTKGAIKEDTLPAHPMELFNQWMTFALSEVKEPNAFVLSTVNDTGVPSSRVLLLRDVNERGLVFFTNYLSQKGQEMASSSHVSMNFFWPKLEQQIRINGKAQKVPGSISDSYFESRPYESQIGAWSSPQSSMIENRKQLDDKVDFFTKKYTDKVPRPSHWGGYVVCPNKVEFWQGRSNRLHDRIVYTKNEEYWLINRLAP